jgi:hypothetical protein
VKSFRANQGLLLAGAVAYYALLSIVPFLMLVVVVLSHFLDEATAADAAPLPRAAVPGQSGAIVTEVAHFLDERDLITWVLASTMVFFSSFAFTVLENAMSVIFVHRVAVRRRHFLVSALLPYCYILALGFGVMIVTLVAGTLQVIGTESVDLFGYSWSLHGVSGALAVPARPRGRDPGADLDLPGDAGGAAVAVACAGRRRDRRAAVGSRRPRAGVVLLHAVEGERGVRLDEHRHRRHVQPRDRRGAAAVRRAGDRGI